MSDTTPSAPTAERLAQECKRYAEEMTREQAIEAYIGMCRRSDAVGVAAVRAWDALPDALRCHPGVKALYAATEAT